jgi:hypothetical protein
MHVTYTEYKSCMVMEPSTKISEESLGKKPMCNQCVTGSTSLQAALDKIMCEATRVQCRSHFVEDATNVECLLRKALGNEKR